VPTYTPLTVKVHLPGDDTVIPSYELGVHLDGALVLDGAIGFPVRLVYRSTYDSVPTLAGKLIDGQQTIGDGIGRGMIIATVRDCAGGLVEGAYVTSSASDVNTKTSYFDGNIEDPVPWTAWWRSSTPTPRRLTCCARVSRTEAAAASAARAPRSAR
jgi:hypothetical protein